VTDPAAGLAQSGADAVLLEQLTDALRPEPLTPSPASMAALRRAVERKWRPTVRARVMEQLTVWARRLQRKGAAVAVLGGVAVGGTGMALAACGSMPPPIQYTLHDLGIPVPPPAAHHDRSQRLDHQAVQVRPRATARPAPTVPQRHALPVATAAPSQRRFPPARTTERLASGGGGRAPQPGSAPVASYRDPQLSTSRQSTLPTGRTSTYGTYGAYGRTSQPAPGTASPAPSGSTTSTAWSSSTPTSFWHTRSAWPRTGAGDYSASGSTYPTIRTGSRYPRYQTVSRFNR
jgi:hypothetical protein